MESSEANTIVENHRDDQNFVVSNKLDNNENLSEIKHLDTLNTNFQKKDATFDQNFKDDFIFLSKHKNFEEIYNNQGPSNDNIQKNLNDENKTAKKSASTTKKDEKKDLEHIKNQNLEDLKEAENSVKNKLKESCFIKKKLDDEDKKVDSNITSTEKNNNYYFIKNASKSTSPAPCDLIEINNASSSILEIKYDDAEHKFVLPPLSLSSTPVDLEQSSLTKMNEITLSSSETVKVSNDDLKVLKNNIIVRDKRNICSENQDDAIEVVIIYISNSKNNKKVITNKYNKRKTICIKIINHFLIIFI